MDDTNNLIEKANALQNLLSSQQTLLMSTVSVSGAPNLSYAPFVRDQSGCFYIFISDLADHATNLRVNKQASVMIVRPEAESRNLFARERAVFTCSVREFQPYEAFYQDHLNALEEKFGEVVSLLRSLSDFHLFVFSPESGRYIAGFGQAYLINVNDGSVSPLNKKHG
jgi:heme iron utilization protein